MRDAITGPGDPGLETREGVRSAIEVGLDLVNVITGELVWEYNDLGSIAVAHVEPWDPRVVAAAAADPSFSLYEETVGRGGAVSALYRSAGDLAEFDPGDADGRDEREEVIREVAGSEGWVVATREAVLGAYAPAPDPDPPASPRDLMERAMAARPSLGAGAARAGIGRRP